MSLHRIAAHVGDRGDIHYSRLSSCIPSRGFEKLRHDQTSEEEMPDIVSCELHFDTVIIQNALWEVHNASAVHYNIDGRHIIPREDLSCSSANGLLVGEIEFQRSGVHIRELCLECVDTLLDLGYVAAGND